MKFIAKHRGSRVHLLLILIVDRSTRKAEEDGTDKSIFNGSEHIAKGGPVGLIDNEDDSLVLNDVSISFFTLLGNNAHLLDRSYDKSVCGVFAFELCD